VTTYVLVHGAWHGGWCWTRVVERLWARGHRAFAPTLTGLGERSHLFSGDVTLATHVDDVVNVLRYEDLHDVVLVGHSYGGSVITGVIEREPERIAAAIFLDAFIPQNGQSVFEIVPEAQRTRQLNSIADAGGIALPPIPAAAFRVNEADRAMVDARCGPQPAATFGEHLAVTEAQARVTRRAFIRAAGYPSAIFDHFRSVAVAAGWQVADLPCGHDAMLDDPDGLVDILLAQGTDQPMRSA
jgi:pimeloyl-ACP methyl ester carboxylesterase